MRFTWRSRPRPDLHAAATGWLTAIALLATPAVTSNGVIRASGIVTVDRVGYRIRSADVVVICPLTVGGSFEARTRQLHGDVALSAAQPGAIEGSLHVDLQSLETGIGLRDRHMRENHLEVQKGGEYATATLDEIRIAQLEGKSSMIGTLLLHGQRREVAGTVELKHEGGRVSVQAEFPLRIADYQIAKPSYLGVGVKEAVRVRVTLVAELTTTR